jgi:hypothetical protein
VQREDADRGFVFDLLPVFAVVGTNIKHTRVADYVDIIGGRVGDLADPCAGKSGDQRGITDLGRLVSTLTQDPPDLLDRVAEGLFIYDFLA